MTTKGKRVGVNKIVAKVGDYLLFTVIGFVLGVILILATMESLISGATRMVDKGVPLVSTNEQFINDITKARVDLNDAKSVWWLVFSQLPGEVNVYPTENYYYFKFFEGGREIWGNIRLDVDMRRNKEISFAYFSVLNRAERPFNSQSFTNHVNFTEEDGVKLQEIGPLTYSITYLNKTVVFHLHDVPQDLPEGLRLREGEEFVSRIFDESGFQLALLFDGQNPAFRFVLDETAPLPDTLEQVEDRLLVGRRSGFAFYEDKELDRKVLIGVDYKNITVNNYYDGPFDQLADNFVTDDTFRNYVTRVFPSLEGKINQRGVFLDEEGKPKNSRLSLQPHLKFYSLQHLKEYVKDCRSKSDERLMVACLTRDDKQREKDE
jgi:hypothetical protein